MIIIGLLISGIFGGMKLIDNANVQKTIQDLKAIETSTLTFRDTYRALPGDIQNPAVRIPNCITAPCSTAGNGNRILDTFSGTLGDTTVALTSERLTFWNHLQTAGFLNLGVSSSPTTAEYGDGQPESAVGGGYRVEPWPRGWIFGGTGWSPQSSNVIVLTGSVTNIWTGANNISVKCDLIHSIDLKMDDGSPVGGRFGPAAVNCVTPDDSPLSVYDGTGANNIAFYFVRF
jgi:hypothetical protein